MVWFARLSSGLFLLLMMVACSYAAGRFDNLGEVEAAELLEMREPSLAAASHGGGAAFRFTWSRSFDDPMAIRLYDDGEKKRVIFKRLSGASGVNGSRSRETIEREVSLEQWNKFLSLFERMKFFEIPSFSEKNVVDTEGAEWCFEAYYHGRYHFVSRWSPEKDYDYVEATHYPNGTRAVEAMYVEQEEFLQEYRAMCLFLLKLSGVSLPDNKIY